LFRVDQVIKAEKRKRCRSVFHMKWDGDQGTKSQSPAEGEVPAMKEFEWPVDTFTAMP
jgi:hypothetical protein